MTLTEHLVELARLWSQATGLSISRLSAIVVNDGKTFERIDQGKTISITTFERFIDFFRRDESWRGAEVPEAATDILAGLPAHAASTGGGSDLSPFADRPAGGGPLRDGADAPPQGDPSTSLGMIGNSIGDHDAALTQDKARDHVG